MITEKKLYKLIEPIIQHIEYLEDNCPDNPNIDKLKQLLLEIDSIIATRSIFI